MIKMKEDLKMKIELCTLMLALIAGVMSAEYKIILLLVRVWPKST